VIYWHGFVENIDSLVQDDMIIFRCVLHITYLTFDVIMIDIVSENV
jgi:hypothetical protein